MGLLSALNTAGLSSFCSEAELGYSLSVCLSDLCVCLSDSATNIIHAYLSLLIISFLIHNRPCSSSSSPPCISVLQDEILCLSDQNFLPLWSNKKDTLSFSDHVLL